MGYDKEFVDKHILSEDRTIKEEKTKMTEYKKYYAGENHCRWEFKLVIYQKSTLYKFVLTDDEDNIYAASNYVSPETAAALEKTIDEIMHKSVQYESLTDIYNALQDTFYGQLFYLGSKIAPQLTDGVLLLSLAE
jgi:hypothetical protein